MSNLPPDGAVPVLQGKRYTVSHKGTGSMALRFFDENGKQIEPDIPSPGVVMAPAGAHRVTIVRGDGLIYAESLIMEDDTPAAAAPKTAMPDRLSIDPRSPFYNAALIARGVGVRFKGTEKRNVSEYCVSERWVRLQTQTKSRDRLGRPLSVKLEGTVEVWMRDEA